MQMLLSARDRLDVISGQGLNLLDGSSRRVRLCASLPRPCKVLLYFRPVISPNRYKGRSGPLFEGARHAAAWADYREIVVGSGICDFEEPLRFYHCFFRSLLQRKPCRELVSLRNATDKKIKAKRSGQNDIDHGIVKGEKA